MGHGRHPRVGWSGLMLLAEAENVLQEAYARAFALAQRQVIVLHHLVGLPVEEVTRELRLATGTVKSRLARGRAAMASILDRERSEVT